MTIFYFFLKQAGSVMFHASVFRREFPEEEQQLGMRVVIPELIPANSTCDYLFL